MGIVRTNIELFNPRESSLGSMKIEAMADTGALMLCIPEHVRVQLKLEELEKREVTTADGRTHFVPYVGPVKVKFENRSCFVGALVMGHDVLLGAVPMEDMDLIISPSRQTVVVNPNSPNFPHATVTSASYGSYPLSPPPQV